MTRLGALTALAMALCALAAGPAGAQPVTVTTARGATLHAIVDLPPGEARVPAVVLAPGQGYAMDQPLLDTLARSLSAQGVAVWRFNWAYMGTVPPGRPSPELAMELADLRAVVAAARQHPRVDGQRLAVGGKSLGSGVAWQLFRQDPDLRAALLLTPVCSRVRVPGQPPVPHAADNYPGLPAEARPSLWVTGDRDPLCAATVLYGHAATAPTVPSQAALARVAVVGGDHGFESPSWPAPEAHAARDRRLAAVAALVRAFLSDVLPDGAADRAGAGATQ